MALISCPECLHRISDMALACPSCGYPLKTAAIATPQKRKPKRRRKLPNGKGSIKHLSGKRSKPYAVYPPVEEFALNGSPVLKPAIGYFATYDEAYQALMLYTNAPNDMKRSSVSFSDLCAAMLSGHNTAPSKYSDMTFAQIYGLYFDSKYNNAKKQFSLSSIRSTKSAFRNCVKLHNRKFLDLKKADLQEVVDACPLKHASLELIVSLFKGMYTYALQNDITDKNYAQYVTINIADDDESGVPFSEAALETLWKNKDASGVGMILLMIYTGFRISAFCTLEYNETEQYLQGGVKTAAGKNRIVPIHPAIAGFAKSFFNRFSAESGEAFQSSKYRNEFHKVLKALNLTFSDSGTKHTPHDCRHTFSWLCDKYNVNDLSKHLLMGHSLGGDVERSVYGHRTLDELRAEINKIKVPYL